MQTDGFHKRERGEHSVECLNPSPVYVRPAGWKRLPGELGRTYNACRKRDVSCDPYFVYLRDTIGRSRHFRKVRANLLNAMCQIMISRCDLDTGIVGISLEDMANDLSKTLVQDLDTGAEVLVDAKVTACRVTRLVTEVLIPYGLVYVLTAENQEMFAHLTGQSLPDYSEQAKDGKVWDRKHQRWFPKILVLTDRFWQLVGANMEKLRAQADRVLADKQAGYVEFGEVALSRREVRELRRREILEASWEKRKNQRCSVRRKIRLSQMTLDERKRAVAEELKREQPSIISNMTAEAFERKVYQELFKLGLGPPVATPPLQ